MGRGCDTDSRATQWEGTGLGRGFPAREAIAGHQIARKTRIAAYWGKVQASNGPNGSLMRHREEGIGLKGLGNTGIKAAIEAVLGSKPSLHK